MTTDRSRRAYMDVVLTTASPEKLLSMLWDRLILDLVVAEQSLGEGDNETAHERLVHAQEIVFELRSTLRTDAWDGGPGLASLYTYVEQQLILANVRKDHEIVTMCRGLLEPLQAAFGEAARVSGATRASLATTA
jgi:flagellar protein FliS